MLITPTDDRRNFVLALCVSIPIGLLGTGLLIGYPIAGILIVVAIVAFQLIRRPTKRRLHVIGQPFPEAWEATLQSHVEYFRALSEDQKDRFRNLIKVFLDEVQVTGIRVDVDEATRALVGASAVIPIMGFDDFEYSRLGEILIYPGSFDSQYETAADGNANILGMVGTDYLTGVMILSKPSLFAGFENHSDQRNVGIHEFAHLVDRADGDIDGLPPTICPETLDPWVRWVGEELRRDATPSEHIDDYAFTNKAEYFAVLSEYFFENPARLEQKNPQLYQMMRKMYHQDTKKLLSAVPRRRRVQRNSPCPCGSGEKYKKCCRRKSLRGLPIG